MNGELREMDRNTLQDLLSQPYDPSRWRDVVDFVFPNVSWEGAPAPIEIPEDDSALFESFSQTGSVRLQDGRSLAMFEVRLRPDAPINLPRNRVALRSKVTRFIDEARNHGILAIYTKGEEDFRFTFAARDTHFTDDGELVTDETGAKRFTYLLGPNETCRTAAERFYELHESRKKAGIEEVIDAFSVEKLNKEFFKNYKAQFDRFCGFLANGDYRESVFGVPEFRSKKENSVAERPIRDFVKKLLARIVFLHFLQKKRWLGCPTEHSKWTDGDSRFLYRLFEECENKEQFHSSCLIPLFFEALNKEDRANDVFAVTGTRVPYLNGGLFENDMPECDGIDFPAAYFTDLFAFLGQYNFTVDENEPDDNEVSIDPEMLGNIFENLLEDNKEKGSYYTPKNVVRYMCRESLLRYLKVSLLENDSPESHARDLEDFVRSNEKHFEHKNGNFVHDNASRIGDKLRNVTICDPAIGSGAFPMGLLHEISRARMSLNHELCPAEVKLSIIKNNIHGVDIDKGAVDIARLRFWLSLVVDQEAPEPLPNLDYKIMQGNSLLEKFEGIRLDQLSFGTTSYQLLGSDQPELFGIADQFVTELDGDKRDELQELMDAYFSERRVEAKQDLHRCIDRFILDHIDRCIAEHEDRISIELQQFQVEIRNRVKNFRVEDLTAKEKKKLAQLEAELADIPRKKEELHKLENSTERPFFLWHLFFSNVMEQGGFDIVIANPPYVRQEQIKAQKEALKDYECYKGTADLFVYFFERAIELLKPHGALTFICSNKYFRAGYGEKLRDYMKQRLCIHQLIDFGDAPVFDATAYPSIIHATRDPASSGNSIRTLVWQQGAPLSRFEQVFAKHAFPLEQSTLESDAWRLEPPEVIDLLKKLRRNGVPLDRYVHGRFYRGVLTGLNDAFVVDCETRDRLIAEHPSSEELLKPFLRGRDIKRWHVEFADQYLIKIESSENVDHPWSNQSPEEAEKTFAKLYPAIHKWFNEPERREALIKRCDQGRFFWELRSCKYWDEFSEPKILYPDIYKHQSFVFDTEGYYCGNTCYFVPLPEQWLAVLLNSTTVEWYYSLLSNRVRGGYLRAFTDYMKQVPICEPNRQMKGKLSAFAGSIPGTNEEALADSLIARCFELQQEEYRLVLESLDIDEPFRVAALNAFADLQESTV